jgi:hypothetical protein
MIYAAPTIEHRGDVIAVTLGTKSVGTIENAGTFVGTTTAVSLETSPEESGTNGSPHGNTASEG